MAADSLGAWAVRWACVFALNLCVPAGMFVGGGPHGPDAWAGFGAAVLALWGGGLTAGAAGRWVRDALTDGGMLLAVLQVVPFVQLGVVWLAAGAWEQAAGPGPLDPTGAVVVTLSAGLQLGLIALAVGYTVSDRPPSPDGTGDADGDDA